MGVVIPLARKMTLTDFRNNSRYLYSEEGTPINIKDTVESYCRINIYTYM